MIEPTADDGGLMLNRNMEPSARQAAIVERWADLDPRKRELLSDADYV
jgi:hypothetical protein